MYLLHIVKSSSKKQLGGQMTMQSFILGDEDLSIYLKIEHYYYILRSRSKLY